MNTSSHKRVFAGKLSLIATPGFSYQIVQICKNVVEAALKLQATTCKTPSRIEVTEEQDDFCVLVDLYFPSPILLQSYYSGARRTIYALSQHPSDSSLRWSDLYLATYHYSNIPVIALGATIKMETPKFWDLINLVKIYVKEETRNERERKEDSHPEP